MTDTIELFPGIQFRKDMTKPLGNQWMFLHEEHWLIAKLAYCDDVSMDHLAKVTRERDALREAIATPESVFINMKAGRIAKVSLRSAIDLHGEVINGDDAQQLEIAELRAERERLRTIVGLTPELEQDGETLISLVAQAKNAVIGVTTAWEEQCARADELSEQVRVLNEQGRTLRLSGCDILEADLIRNAMRNVRGNRRNTRPRWSLVKDVFGNGSGVSTALCCRFNLDPDEVLKN